LAEALKIVESVERIAFERGRQMALASPFQDGSGDDVSDLVAIVGSLPKTEDGYALTEPYYAFARGRDYGRRQAAAEGLDDGP